MYPTSVFEPQRGLLFRIHQWLISPSPIKTTLRRVVPSHSPLNGWTRPIAMVLVILYLGVVAGQGIAISLPGGYGVEVAPLRADVPDAWAISKVVPGGAAEIAGLRPGDVVVAVEGLPVTEKLNLLRPSADRRAGDPITLYVQRAKGEANGSTAQTEQVAVTVVSSLMSPIKVIVNLAFGALGLLLLAVSIGPIFARPRDPAARLLMVWGASFAFALAGAPLPTIAPSFTLFVIGCAALLHLFLIFPAPNPFMTTLLTSAPAWLRRVGGWTFLIYAVPLALTLGLPFTDLPVSSGLVGTLLLVAGLLTLVRGYRHPPSALARAQLRWILWGLTLVVASLALIVTPVGAAVLVPVVLIAGPDIAKDLLLIAVMTSWVFFPISIAVAVLRYRLFDVRIVVRATILYPLLIGVLVGSYAALAFVLGQAATALAGPDADSTSLSAFAALVVAVAAAPMRTRLLGLLDRMIYRDRLALRMFLQEAAEQLGRAQPPEVVAAFLTTHAARQLDLTDAWLVLPAEVTSSGEGESAKRQPAEPQPLIERLRGAAGPVVLAVAGELEASGVVILPGDEPATAPWYAAGARVLVPLGMSASDQEPADEAADGSGENAVTVPAAPQELIGVWALGLRRSELFDREELAALGRVGHQAAVLLDYARLHRDQVQQELSRHELARAREIQRHLLPERLSGWPGKLDIAVRFRPARETSGDFYDVFPLAPASSQEPAPDAAPVPLQIAVGDVAGKGIGAALVMALARNTLRAVARPTRAVFRGAAAAGTTMEIEEPAPLGPGDTMRLASGLLYPDVGRRDFVACALAVVEPPDPSHNGHGRSKLRLANAAQVPVLLVREGQATELEPPGERLPLGVLAEPDYGELVTDLGPGDVVIFASDGLPEAPSLAAGAINRLDRDGGSAPVTPGELFGFQRLATSANYWAANAPDAEAVAEGVWTDVAAWAGESSSHDDMTLVVLRVPPVHSN